MILQTYLIILSEDQKNKLSKRDQKFYFSNIKNDEAEAILKEYSYKIKNLETKISELKLEILKLEEKINLYKISRFLKKDNLNYILDNEAVGSSDIDLKNKLETARNLKRENKKLEIEKNQKIKQKLFLENMNKSELGNRAYLIKINKKESVHILNYLEKNSLAYFFIGESKEWANEELDPVSSQIFAMLGKIRNIEEIGITFQYFFTLRLILGFLIGDAGYGVLLMLSGLFIKEKVEYYFFTAGLFSFLSGIFIYNDFFGVHILHSRVIDKLDILFLLKNSVYRALLTLVMIYVISGINAKGVSKIYYFGKSYSFFILFLAIYIKDIRLLYLIIIPGINQMLFYREIRLVGGLQTFISFVRLAALLFAKAQMAHILNTIAHSMRYMTAIRLLVVGHLLILGLGLFSGFLNSIRIVAFDILKKMIIAEGILYKKLYNK